MFQGGFEHYNTLWTLNDWLVIGAAALILILLLVVWPIVALASKGKKKDFKKESEGVGSSKRLVYRNEQTNDTLLFAGANAWLADSTGRTELYKSVEGTKVALVGKVIYLVKDVKRVEVLQQGDQIRRNQTYEKQYITFDFVSKNEVKVGVKSFFTEAAIANQHKLADQKAAKDAKEQEKADQKAAKIQAKADKRLAKAEKKFSE